MSKEVIYFCGIGIGFFCGWLMTVAYYVLKTYDERKAKFLEERRDR